MKVAVAGARSAGSAWRQGLIKAGLEVTVYERDQALDAGGQGYRLHLDAEPPLRACLPPDLYDLCVATSGRPGTAVTVVSKSLRTLRRIELEPKPERDAELGEPADPQGDPRRPAGRRHRVRPRLHRVRAASRRRHRPVRRRVQRGSRRPGRRGRHRLAGAPPLPAARAGGGHRIVCVYGRTPLTAQTRPLLPAPVRDGFTAVLGSGVGMAAGLLDFREPPPQAARRIAPDVRLSPARPYLMWAVTGAARASSPSRRLRRPSPAGWASFPGGPARGGRARDPPLAPGPRRARRARRRAGDLPDRRPDSGPGRRLAG